MKFKNFLYSLIVFSVGFSSCKKAASYHDIIFFTGTEQTPETRLTLDGAGSIGLTITSSKLVEKDVNVKLKADDNLVEAYNKLTGNAYLPLPAGSYTLSGESVTIKGGSNVSNAVKLSVSSTDNFKDGATYCVPVTILNDDSDIDVLEPSKTIYVILNKTIITDAVNLNGNYFRVPSFATDAKLLNVDALTMECRIYINSFQNFNPFISSIMGMEENVLLRFGDVSIPKDKLQLAGGTINGKKFPVSSNASFSTGQWYHVAAVYDGASWSLYVNGKLNGSTQADKGTITFGGSLGTIAGGFHIGYSANGRLLDGYISEARVWTKARTAIEIQNSICAVDPTSKDLLAYWKFNSDTDDKVTDLTGHGYTAIAAGDIKYVKGIKCP